MSRFLEKQRAYFRYLRNNPEGYWFKRKLYGWGWTPVTREGWFVTLLIIGLVLLRAFTFDFDHATDWEVFTVFLPQVGALIGILILICFLKGEKPKWTWRFPEESEEETSPPESGDRGDSSS